MVLEQFEPTESRCQKWSTISRWKGEIVSSFFQVIQWLEKRCIIGQCCFHHLPLHESMACYEFRGEKRFERLSLRFLVLRLSNFTKAAWVKLILWTSMLSHIVCIESHLLDFTSAFSLIWWTSHVSIVTSLITWRIQTNCLFLITRLLSKKIYFNTIKAGKGQHQYRDHLRGRTNPNRLIIMEDIYQITKQCTKAMWVLCNRG